MATPGTWEEVVRQALLELGAKAAGETLDSDERADGMSRLVDMLEEWGTDGLIVPGLTIVNHDIVSGASSFTVGPGGDIEIAKPMEAVYSINYKRAGLPESYPLNQTSFAALSARRDRTSTAPPTRYFYNRSHPRSEIMLDSLAQPGDSLEIGFRGHFANITYDGLSADLLPVGYRNAVILNLAVLLAPQYGAKRDGSGLSQDTARRAMRSLRKIRARNIGSMVARLDSTLTDANSIDQLLPKGYGRYD